MSDDEGGGGKIQVLTPEQLGALNQAKVHAITLHKGVHMSAMSMLWTLSYSVSVSYSNGWNWQVMIRIDNEHYLRDHLDVTKVMRGLVRGIIRDRPKNASTYAYRFFSRDVDAIRKDLDAKD